ncbi:TIGR01458 family HAD-type hydrolase [Marinobacterium sp. YM272]|uniref:TIGR01458 family HAD-type hydrolase n=1 Tax=Marinobacterium sp. YM272 TaxID=3421654 RepID=UPI003D7FE923
MTKGAGGRRDDIRGVLLDLDGVLYVDDVLIEGTLDVIDWLQGQSLPFRYITNTSTKTREQLAAHLADLGLPVGPESVFSAVQATQTWLAEQGISRIAVIVNDSVRGSLAASFEIDETAPEAVVIGDIGTAWDYARLNRAFQWLVNGARLVCIHRNRYWKTGDSLALDIGAFVAGLEYAAQVEAVVIGKPANAFFQAACASLGLQPAEVAVVGDDVESDIGGAIKAGCTGVLVETGKYRPELVKRSGITPDYQIASIAKLPELLG